MKIVVIYDDTVKKSEVIEDIIGEKGFADVVVKKRYLEEYYRDEIEKIFPDVTWRKIHSRFEYEHLLRELDLMKGSDLKIMHCFSNFLISDPKSAGLSFKKLFYIEEPMRVISGHVPAACMFGDMETYREFCKGILAGREMRELLGQISLQFEIEGLVDIGQIGNFIQCVTGNFDSRYFNSLKGNEYTLVKTSANKKKIKAEYTFYHLLPEDMKFWFVMPFNYTETENAASYTMERLHMTDLAIKWVHGSMEEEEFESLLDKYFFFFKSRHKKECTAEEYQSIAENLYDRKVRTRIEDLKQLTDYKKIKALLDVTEDVNLDALLEKYFVLKKKIEAKNQYPQHLVIGHGDPCFANALYNKSTKTLKFIDPKGALIEDELWTNPYYDVAKLSHSICGNYDFFNNALFDIRINTSFSYSLDIPFDNRKYVEVFRRKLEENGFDYLTVRLYEASLFLSMLPLHIDNPHKVFGFILNVKNILEMIEKDV